MDGFKRVFDASAISMMLITLAICAVVQSGCSADTRLALSVTNPAAEHLVIATPTAISEGATRQLLEITPTPSALSSASVIAAYPPPSLDQMIAKSHIVAKSKLIATGTRVERVETGHKHLNGGRFFALYMDFKFEVLEYLKGSGNSEIWASVMAGGGFDTRQEALSAAVDYWTTRDRYIYSRWDGREAIVLLYDLSSSNGDVDRGLARQSDTYLLGAMHIGNGFWESFSVASPRHRAWLPAAQPSGVSGASGDAQQFLLEAPGGYAAGGPSGGVSGASEEDAPTITLSALKSKIAAMEATPTPVPTNTPEPSPTPAP